MRRDSRTPDLIAPVIARGLGRLLLAEQVTPRPVAGGGTILVGIALMVWSSRRAQRSAEAQPQPVEPEELAA